MQMSSPLTRAHKPATGISANIYHITIAVDHLLFKVRKIIVYEQNYFITVTTSSLLLQNIYLPFTVLS